VRLAPFREARGVAWWWPIAIGSGVHRLTESLRHPLLPPVALMVKDPWGDQTLGGLNAYLHFHYVVIDCVFDAAAAVGAMLTATP
jgi:hypothetical protein